MKRARLAGLGLRVGYRFNLGDHFYVTPWVSFSYQFNAKDMIISGRRFEETKYRIFPTVHLGCRF
jgi:outer membrane autotransporter protein